MSTMKKRIPMFLLALAMMVAMAVPAFALPTSGENNHFYAWSGTVVGGSKVALTEMGTEQRLKARTYTGLSSQKWRVMQKTEGGYVIENENGDCVNIYRIIMRQAILMSLLLEEETSAFGTKQSIGGVAFA